VFGAPGAKEHYGWVALGRRQSGAWVPHFNGYTISDTSLPPPGTVLSAQIMLPVWSEPQGTTNDQSKLLSASPVGLLLLSSLVALWFAIAMRYYSFEFTF